jgi:hypothetical protein
MKPRKSRKGLVGKPQRERLLARSGGLCELCNQPPDWRGLSVHHLKPKGMGGTTHQYTDDELRLVCGLCHAALHHIKEGR